MKTLTEMLADIRFDLKDSGTLWSDGELVRSVKKAVADLSRFLPLERNYEATIDTVVTAESFTTLAASDPDAFVDNMDISGTSADSTCTLTGTQPDLPRPVKVTITDANTSITALVLIVKGNDADDRYIEESFYLAGGLVQTGKKYFKRITEVEIDQIAGNGTGDALDVGTGSPTGVWIKLANRPIKPSSESVTATIAGTSYARDTGFIMDYVEGRIALKSGSTIVAATAHSISYTKSRISVDVSSLPDLIRVNRVEYPARNVPQTFMSFDIWNKVVTLTGDVESQSEASDKEHAVVQYYAEHTPPGVSAPGSYPSFLDATVELAASAYALFIKALQYEHQAVTDFASARTALGNLAAIHVLAKASLVSAGTQFTASVVAGLFTKVDVALDAIAAIIGTATTYLTGATAPSAKKYLDDGDAYLTVLTTAAEVSAKHSDFARACNELATAILAQASAYTNEATVRLTESDRWVSAGRAWTEQVSIYLVEIDKYLEESSRYILTAQNNLSLAESYRTEGIEKRNEVWSIWRDSSQYLGDFTMTAVRQPGSLTS